MSNFVKHSDTEVDASWSVSSAEATKQGKQEYQYSGLTARKPPASHTSYVLMRATVDSKTNSYSIATTLWKTELTALYQSVLIKAARDTKS